MEQQFAAKLAFLISDASKIKRQTRPPCDSALKIKFVSDILQIAFRPSWFLAIWPYGGGP